MSKSEKTRIKKFLFWVLITSGTSIFVSLLISNYSSVFIVYLLPFIPLYCIFKLAKIDNEAEIVFQKNKWLQYIYILLVVSTFISYNLIFT